MKVLITGGEGYIGALLGPLLMARGHEPVLAPLLEIEFLKDVPLDLERDDLRVGRDA